MSTALLMGRSYEKYSTPSGKINETHSGKHIATPSGTIASRCMDSSRTASLTPLGLNTFNLINKSVNSYSNCANPAHSFTCHFDFAHEHELSKVRSGTWQLTKPLANTGTIHDITHGTSGDISRTTLSVDTHLGHSNQEMTGKHSVYSAEHGH